MHKRSSKKKYWDREEVASAIVRSATDTYVEQEREKNPAAVALGRLGGKVGGKARAAMLSAKRRSEIASLAARARWKKEERHGTD